MNDEQHFNLILKTIRFFLPKKLKRKYPTEVEKVRYSQYSYLFFFLLFRTETMNQFYS